MDTKKFITGKGFDKETTQFLLKDNLTDFSIFDVVKGKKGAVKFKTVTDFHNVEEHNLDTHGQMAFELFYQFNNVKNAIACITKSIEDESPISNETFALQSKITPAVYTDEMKKMKTFKQYWDSLDAEQKLNVASLAKKWMDDAGIDRTNFEFFFINGENGLTLAVGQTLKIYDPLYGNKIFTRVHQASPNGLVTLLDDGSTFSLSKESAKTIEIVPVAEVPAEVEEFFSELEKTYIEDANTRKTDKLEKGLKLQNKADEINQKMEEKKEKEAKALELSNKELAEIKAMEIKTKEQVDEVVNQINAKAKILLPVHKKELSAMVKTAKESFKPKAETIPAEATPATEEEAPAMAEASPAEATESPKATSRPQRKKPLTIDDILQEDAQSENPIL